MQYVQFINWSQQSSVRKKRVHGWVISAALGKIGLVTDLSYLVQKP